ncbi:hypothetical protein ACFQY9_22630 [Microvirga aerilata]|uniref:hypothetical protein n=1 Tax=Microvirga aerilata TaxID=670292 RepID=UPI00362D7879
MDILDWSASAPAGSSELIGKSISQKERFTRGLEFRQQIQNEFQSFQSMESGKSLIQINL